MTQTMATEEDFARAERLSRAMNDAMSRDALQRYLREIEYDALYRDRARDRRRTVLI